MAASQVQGLYASVSAGDFMFVIDADKATARDILVAGSATTVSLSAIYAMYKSMTSRRKAFNTAVNKGLGEDSDDKKMWIIESGSLRVLLNCFTGERFLEVFGDYKSGKIKERLKKEFLNIGIETEGMAIDVENIGEVEEKATAIRNKIEKENQEQEKRTPKDLLEEREPTIPQIIVQAGAYRKRTTTWSYISEEEYINEVKNSAQEGYDILKEGGTAVDAVEAAVGFLENHKYFNAGYGSILTENGEVECDTMIMDGESLNTGAVISGRHFRNPVKLAKMIMNGTLHCALSGEGALQFAQKKGFPICHPTDLVTEHAKNLKIPHSKFPDYTSSRFEGEEVETNRPKDTVSDFFKETGTGSSSDETSVVANESGGSEGLPDVKKTGRYSGGDTVSAVARDIHGRLACAVSTGGIPGKMTGRVSDASMVGCGGYANKHGAATTSGQGETLMKMTLAREVVYMMESGQNAQESAENALHKMRNQFKYSGLGGVIAIDKEGNFGKAFTTEMMGWASIKDGKPDCGLDERMES